MLLHHLYETVYYLKNSQALTIPSQCPIFKLQKFIHSIVHLSFFFQMNDVVTFSYLKWTCYRKIFVIVTEVKVFE